MGTVTRLFLSIVSLLSIHTVNAQLCQGSLGDPIINTTFGNGGNPGPALAAAATNYQFYGSDCPSDGLYTVRNNTVDCFGASWHTLNTDHTGDGSGYFMLVNASFDPGAFYVEQVHGLCSNTTFEFAAWVINVLKSSACGSNGIQPNLTFSIEKLDGTLLQSYQTGDIANQSSAQWKQYGFFFSTPPGVTDIVLRIVNNAPGGCGNDLALDDITFRPCGPQILATIDNQNTTRVNFCQGPAASYLFSTNVSAGFSDAVYQWQQSTDSLNWTNIPGAVSTAYTANFPANATPGKYYYRMRASERENMSSPNCGVASPALVITVNPVPETVLTSNSPVCEGATLTMSATGGTAFQWLGKDFAGNGSSLSIANVQLSNAGKVYLVADNAVGCTHTDSTIITVLPKPNAAASFSSTTICGGESVELTGVGGGDYKWTPSTGLSADDIANPVASPADNINYTLEVTAANGCTDSTQVEVIVIKEMSADAGPDKTILAGGSVPLNGAVNGQDISFSWSPSAGLSDAGVLQPIASPSADIDYTLTVTSNAGCGTKTDQVHVFVFKDIYIPTAFSPDGNGINDTWNIPALNAFSSFELSVYNRAGNLVYQNRNSFKPWDGTYKGEPQPAGVYVYVIDLKVGVRSFKGTVTIVR